MLAELADGVDPEAVQLLEGLGADPPQRLHRQRVEEREDLAVVDDLDAEPWFRTVRSDAGLGRLGGQLGHELGGGHPHRAREALLVEDGGPDLGADRRPVTVEPACARDVEERFVEGDGLDQRGEGREDRHHALG